MAFLMLAVSVLVSLLVGAALYLTVALLWGAVARSKRVQVVLASLVVVGLLAACVVPPAHYSDDHAIWLENLRRTGF